MTWVNIVYCSLTFLAHAGSSPSGLYHDSSHVSPIKHMVWIGERMLVV